MRFQTALSEALGYILKLEAAKIAASLTVRLWQRELGQFRGAGPL
jgi:hypothetical protein